MAGTFAAALVACGNDDCAESSTCAGEVNAPDGGASGSDSGGSEASSGSESGPGTDSASDSANDSTADSNTPWTPAKITNLVLWLDGDDATANANGSVDTWFDKSPSKTDAKTSTATQKPVLLAGGSSINAHKALRFDGATTFLTITDAASLQWTQSFDVEVVFRNAAATQTAAIFTKRNATGLQHGPELTLLTGSSPFPTYVELELQINAFVDSDKAGFAPGAHRIHAAWDLASTTLTLQVDKATANTSVGAATEVGAIGFDALIGKDVNTPTNFLKGDLAEIVAVAGTAISQADILQLQEYLDNKYGL